jgi:flagellar basal-body rod protein FlgC
MFDTISASAASGLAAAAHRTEASASNVANIDSRGALPVGQAANANAPSDVRETYVLIRVEQSSAPDGGGTITTERPVRPSFVPASDPGASYADEDGLAAAPNVDVVEEIVEQIEAQNAFAASARTIESVQEMVRSLYDLPEG